MAIALNCIFQGGGARLATLLVACEVLEDLQAEGIVQICGAAGTSAGSIAAFSLARPQPTSETRSKILIEGPNIAYKLNKFFIIKLIRSIIFGSPIYPRKTIYHFVNSIFTREDGSAQTLEDARFPIYIRAADICNGQKITYSSRGEVENSPSVGQVLSDSCAIPFAFRSYKSDSSVVDGGLVSNLAESTIFGNNLQTKLIAFSFRKSKEVRITNIKSYFKAIISTVMDASVLSSAEEIRKNGGHICLLPNDFDTLDFNNAFSEGLSGAYITNAKLKIRESILSIIKKMKEDDRKPNNEDVIRQLNTHSTNVSRILSKIYPYSVMKTSLICLANGLENDSRSDILFKDMEIYPTEDKLLYFRIGVTRGESFDLGRLFNYELTDTNGEPVRGSAEIVKSEQNEKSLWHVHFCLDKPLEKSRCPLKVRVRTTHIGLMRNLARPKGIEWIRTESNQTDAVGPTDLILAAPIEPKAIVLVDLYDNLYRLQGSNVVADEMSGRWSQGKKMSKESLEKYRVFIDNLVGYNLFGWRSESMLPNTFCGVLIERID